MGGYKNEMIVLAEAVEHFMLDQDPEPFLRWVNTRQDWFEKETRLTEIRELVVNEVLTYDSIFETVLSDQERAQIWEQLKGFIKATIQDAFDLCADGYEQPLRRLRAIASPQIISDFALSTP